MTGFSKEINIGNETLEFKFTLIHSVNSKRYFVVVNEKDRVTCFYMQQDPAGKWQLADKFHVVPKWVFELEHLLVKIIHEEEQSAVDCEDKDGLLLGPL